jgi:hypothetical protein
LLSGSRQRGIGGLLPVVDFLEDAREFLFEQIQGPKLQMELQYVAQLSFFQGL